MPEPVKKVNLNKVFQELQKKNRELEARLKAAEKVIEAAGGWWGHAGRCAAMLADADPCDCGFEAFDKAMEAYYALSGSAGGDEGKGER